MSEDFLCNKNVERFESMLSKNETWYYDAEEMVDIITFYVDINDLKNAQKALNYGFNIHPDHLELQIKKVEILIAKRRFTQASELIGKLSPMFSSHTDLLVAQAKLFSIKKQYKKAIEYYQKALKNDDEVIFLLSSIGNEYLNLNKYTIALSYFKKALKIDEEDEYAFYSVIHCYHQKEDEQGCITFLKKYINEHPYADYAWYNLGLEYVKQHNFSEAIRSFDFVILINEQFLSAYGQKANALEKTDQFEEAIKVYKTSLQYEDAASFTHLKIGLCYKKLNLSEKALTSFYSAVYDDPQMDKAWEEISLIYAERKKPVEALHYLEKAIGLNPENIHYLKKHIAYSLDNKNVYDALVTYDKLISLMPEDENYILGKAELLILTKEYGAAIRLLKTYKKDTFHAESLYYLSFCYFLTYQNQSGLDCFKQAYKLAPERLLDYQKCFPKIFENKQIKDFLKTQRKQDNL